LITVRDLAALRERIARARAAGRTIGFVPTMGALHEGHLSLVRLVRGKSAFTVVSIFVNPLQFGPTEDLARYPRDESRDERLLEGEGVDLVYIPDPSRFYPPDFSTSVEVAGVSEGGEGARRPGHFRGVATVVSKLFLQVAPDLAVFGRKDLQQLALVRRLVRDLDFPVRILAGEIVREKDGLAMSSRNAYLSPEERSKAPDLARALSAARARATRGESDAAKLEADVRAQLLAAGFAVDYAEAVDADSMERVETVAPGVALAAAVRLGKTRLIDNVFLSDSKEADPKE
jgi:pantoate--beta-alanine ligase